MADERLLAIRRENMRRGREQYQANVAGRREDYYWLRDDQGLTREQAAARLGITIRTAFRYDAARRVAQGEPLRCWDTELIAERQRLVAELYGQGWSDGRIAARLGITASGVLYIRRRLGLPALYGPGGALPEAVSA